MSRWASSARDKHSALRRIMRLPPGVIVRKLARKGARAAEKLLSRRRDARAATYSSCPFPGPLHQYVRDLSSPQDVDLGMLADLCAHYLAHRFDLLGSGWIRPHHGMRCCGVEGCRYPEGPTVHADVEGRWLADRLSPCNVTRAQQTWRLISAPYLPLDWQLDYVSGYRWSEKVWYRDIRVAPAPGADIKVPWELARMQHLPQLAQACWYARRAIGPFQSADIYAREFRNQVLDFIATNPPRFGVNWACTMDVAIRVVNWLIAYDVFREGGHSFDAEFDEVFLASIHEHGRHIVDNLEWFDGVRANHYLANVAGLLYVSAYLPSTTEIDAWLVFSVQELLEEVGYQFNGDGTNFEGSTSYHRLSAEMVVYATALVLGLQDHKAEVLTKPAPRGQRLPRLRQTALSTFLHGVPQRRTVFPPAYFERIERMAEFSMHITKHDGAVVQVGDNDSGRFFKLDLPFVRRTVKEARALYRNLEHYDALEDCDTYWDEVHLDHRGLISCVNEWLRRKDFEAMAGERGFGPCLIRALSAGFRAEGGAQSGADGTACDHAENLWTWLGRLRRDRTLAATVHRVPAAHSGLWRDLAVHAYPGFGLYVYRSDRMFLSIRCGAVGHLGLGIHSHVDQLAVELQIDGEDWIADPGSYLYTASPRARNAYRSAKAHFTPRGDEEGAASLERDLFRLEGLRPGRCLYFAPDGFVGNHAADGADVYRVLRFDRMENMIVIEDFSPPDRTPAPSQRSFVLDGPRCPIAFSPGYGMVRR